MCMGERIKSLRLQAGMTQEELGNKIGVKKAAIQKYESGAVKNLKRTTIKILADIFNVSSTYLLGIEDERHEKKDNHISEELLLLLNNPRYNNIYPVKNKKYIPVIGHIAAGVPMIAEEHFEYMAANESDLDADFALKVEGDSMINARIFHGDIVFIHEQSDVEDGEIAAVLIDGEATLKRVYKMPGRVQLRAENPKYAPRDFTRDNCEDFKILGKAVGFQSKL